MRQMTEVWQLWETHAWGNIVMALQRSWDGVHAVEEVNVP